MQTETKHDFYRKLALLVTRIEDNLVFSSIKKGLLLLIPVLVTGSVALMIRSFPLDAFQVFLTHGSGTVLLTICNLFYDATFGFLSVFLLLGITYYYAGGLSRGDRLFRLAACLVAFSSFAASFGALEDNFRFSYFGAIGVFTAIFCAIFAPWLFFQLCRKLPRWFRSYAAGADQSFRSAISMIVPFALTVLPFVLLSLLLQTVFHVGSFNDVVSNLLRALFENIDSELGGGVLFVVLLNLLWFFGIHGGNMLEQVAESYFAPADTNPTAIVSKSFLDNFSLMGGCGATLCLLLALALFSRVRSNRQLAGSAAPFAIFNMNEILVFGLPILFNPILFVPFLLTPVVCLLISYMATAVGFIPIVNNTVTWTTPVFFSGYIATGTIRGAVVQLVCLIAGAALYAPFLRLQERMEREREGTLIDALTREYFQAAEKGKRLAFLDRNDDLGRISKTLATQLRSDISHGRVPVHYQPQVDTSGRVAGAEALLRWQYLGQAVAPPLVVALSREDHTFDELTAHVLRTAADDLLKFDSGGHCVVSVNVTAEQVNDAKFIAALVSLAEQKHIEGRLCIEITEDSALNRFDRIAAHLAFLQAHGILAAIDDFSMGHTSMTALQSNHFRYVKLDGTLVRQASDNQRSRDIIRSIASLGEQLGFEVVAEYVENEALRGEMLELGCRYFQGYLYSPAIPADEFAAYCQASPGANAPSSPRQKP